VVIDLNRAYRVNRTYSFILSVWGLKVDSLRDYIEIDKIEIELEGDKLIEIIKDKFGK